MVSRSEESHGSIHGVKEIGKHDQRTSLPIHVGDLKKHDDIAGSNASSVVDKITPLPTLGMSLMFAIQLNEAMMINVLYPFLVFMTESFGYTGQL